MSNFTQSYSYLLLISKSDSSSNQSKHKSTLSLPRPLFFCVLFFGLICLLFCLKNAFSEMRTQKRDRVIFIRTRPVRTLKDTFWTQQDAFWTPKQVLGTLSKEDLTGHKQKKEHFVTYAKKNCCLSETSFSFKRVIGDSR